MSWSWLNLAENDAEPDEMDVGGGGHHEPAGRAGVLGVLIPTPTLENFVLAARRPDGVRDRRCRIGLEPIGAPFPNVAVHVV